MATLEGVMLAVLRLLREKYCVGSGYGWYGMGPWFPKFGSVSMLFKMFTQNSKLLTRCVLIGLGDKKLSVCTYR